MLPKQLPYISDDTDISESTLNNHSSDLFSNTQQINPSSVNSNALDSNVNPETNHNGKSLLVESTSSQTTDKAETVSYQLPTNSGYESLSLSSEKDDIIPSSALLQEISVNIDTYQPSNHLPDNKNLLSDSIHQSDNLLLHKQIETLTCKLMASQDQIDRLLEEKRIWVENMQRANNSRESNHQVTPGELRGRWIQAKNLAETYKREKESMVIKYAQSEQKRIQLEQQIHSLECKIGRLCNSNNFEQHQQTEGTEKIDNTDKSSVGNQPHKTSVINSSIANSDSNEKSNIEHLQKDLALAREQIESLSKKQSGDESRISALTSKLSQVQESLKSEQKKSSSLTENLNRVNKSLENALKQAKEAERLREREAERLCSEVALQEAQTSSKQLRIENDTLKQQLKVLENVKSDLEKSQSRIDELTSKLSSANDLTLELQSCKRRVDQLSDFTRRLTERHANLQAEHLVTLSSLEETRNLLIEKGEEIVRLNEKHGSERKESEVKMNSLQCELNDLSVKLHQLNESENWLKIQLKEEKERATAIHKRDAARIKDIAREVTRLSHCQNKRNQSDCSRLTINSPSDLENESNSKSSTNSLNGSLKSLDLTQVISERENETIVSPISTLPMKNTVTNQLDDCLPLSVNNNNKVDNYESTIVEMSSNFNSSDRDILLEKIDRLQRSQVKLTDKIEFFQEHCYQLTEELNKKSKVIQNLLVSIDKQCGSTTSFVSDNHSNKKMLNVNQKYNSIISSLSSGSFKTKAADTGSYLGDNSQKLQNLLEDTIFKNITLKESLNKLGLEISSLRLTHERILNSLCDLCKVTIEDILKTSGKSIHQFQHSNHHLTTQPESEPPLFQNGGVNA
ncbi:hypothetical protein Smp_166370 [Schistosoma mansoni]|uniref:hypothetical protein n=1 Tax=Schistosoma mansoni TaxID=6183 RepID=UPI0001A62115|nr:hypothetical protein Smp_166370 [Schistosoma mansoni]|eukprot:XP_018649374.1 hypothetical protein Smp_166370 [Schistosoma mansoni]